LTAVFAPKQKSNRMRTPITFLICLFFGWAQLQAQTPIIVTGHITDSFNQPVVTMNVTIKAGSGGAVEYSNTVYTNQNGQYNDSFSLSNGTHGFLTLISSNCHGDTLYEHRTWQAPSGFFNVDFQFCPSNSSSGTSCSANFTWQSAGGLSVQFVPVSSGSQYTYLWHFGDGTTSAQSNPLHTYAQAGTYPVVLVIYNGNPGGCLDSAFHTITVSNSGPCQAGFGYTASGYTVSFRDSSHGNPASYLWNFGDGHTDTSSNPVHLYNTPGPFWVCLTISGPNCQSTYCDSVFVGPPTGGCVAQFSHSQQGNTVSFVSQSNGSLFGWDFGDGNGATSQHATHTYAAAGTYVVCHWTSIPGTTCADTVCQTIVVGPGTNTWNLCGQVVTGNQGADHATVYLIAYDSAQGGILTAVDSTFVAPAGGGQYCFYHLPTGTYRVKAALNPASTVYSQYMPTYFDTTLFWYNAFPLNLSTNLNHIDIHMVPGNNPGGPGFIGGLVSQGANKTSGPGDPMAGISVLLLKNYVEGVTHATSGADGKFSFENIAYGTYQVVVEIPGKTSEVHWATVSPGQDSVKDLQFNVHTTNITTGIFPGPGVPEVDVRWYPNPARNQVIFQAEGNLSGPVDLLITDLTGRVLLTSSNILVQQGDVYVADLKSIAAGLYLVELRQDGRVVKQGKLVRID
jgi:PKD repeat protein